MVVRYLAEEDNLRQLQQKWLAECGDDLRARTQAEYLYTAAALAMIGGVCWGALSVKDVYGRQVLLLRLTRDSSCG
jgi:hypothetical protein